MHRLLNSKVQVETSHLSCTPEAQWDGHHNSAKASIESLVIMVIMIAEHIMNKAHPTCSQALGTFQVPCTRTLNIM